MSPSAELEARNRVLDALVTIQMFDTDRAFIELSKRRYLAIFGCQDDEKLAEDPLKLSRRADGGANITTIHSAIAGQK